MANPHINYTEYMNKVGNFGVTEWAKYNWLKGVDIDHIILDSQIFSSGSGLNSNIIPTGNRLTIEADFAISGTGRGCLISNYPGNDSQGCISIEISTSDQLRIYSAGIFDHAFGHLYRNGTMNHITIDFYTNGYINVNVNGATVSNTYESIEASGFGVNPLYIGTDYATRWSTFSRTVIVSNIIINGVRLIPVSGGFYNESNGTYLTGISGHLPTDGNPYCPMELKEYTTFNRNYIDTGVIGDVGYTVECEMKWNALATGSYQYPLGYVPTGSSDRVYYLRQNNVTDEIGYTFGPSITTRLVSVDTTSYHVYKSVMKNGYQELFIDGTSVGSSTAVISNPRPSGAKLINIWIGAAQYVNIGNGNGFSNVNFKWIKITDSDGKLRRWYVAVENGLYDYVTKKFYALR